MTLHKLDKSWLITWLSIVLFTLAIIVVPNQLFAHNESEPHDHDNHNHNDSADFRIVDVRSAQGKLVLEVQHIDKYGKEWFYELYTWDGLLNERVDRETNILGEFLREDNTVAPYRSYPVFNKETNSDVEELEQYIPTGYITLELVTPAATWEDIFLRDPEDPENAGFTTIVQMIEGENPGQHQVVTGIIDDYGVFPDSIVEGMTGDEVQAILGEPRYVGTGGTSWHYDNGAFWKLKTETSLEEMALLNIVGSMHYTRIVSGWTRDIGRSVLPIRSYSENEAAGANILASKFSYLINKAYKINEDGLIEEYFGELPEVESFSERIDLRTRDSKTFQIAIGTLRSTYEPNIHYKDDEGDWRETSLNLIQDPDNPENWSMVTHPWFKVEGNQSTISFLSSDGEYGGRWYTPAPLSYEGNTAWYEYEGLKWIYTLNNAGIKLTAKVTNPLGQQEYDFVFQPLGFGVQSLRLDLQGNAVTGHTDVFYEPIDGLITLDWFTEESEFGGSVPRLVVPKPVLIGSDQERFDAGSWEILDEYRIRMNFDDSIVPEISYPYLIDPTVTFSVSSGTDDGTVQCTATAPTVSNCGHNTDQNSATVKYNSTEYDFTHIRFNTSSLPDDALILEADLKIACHSKQTSGDQHILFGIGWAHGKQPYANPQSSETAGAYTGYWPIDDTDIWTNEQYKTSPGDDAHRLRTVTDICEQGHNVLETFPLRSMNMNNLGHTSWPRMTNVHVNRTGWTELFMFMDDMHGHAGTGDHQMTFHTSEHGSEPTPQLVITYATDTLKMCPATQMKFYPDADGVPGQGSWDGYGQTQNAGYPGLTWDQITRSNVSNFGNGGGDSWSPMRTIIQTDASYNLYEVGERIMLSFDTSAIPDDAFIIEGRVGLYIHSAYHYNDRDYGGFGNYRWRKQGLALIDFDPQSETTFTNGDMHRTSYMRLSNDKLMENMGPFHVANSTPNVGSFGKDRGGGYEVWDLTDVGKDYIKKDTENTSFQLALGMDIDNDFAWWQAANRMNGISAYNAEDNWGPTGLERDPYLEVRYVLPCAEVDNTSTVNNNSVSTFYTGVNWAPGTGMDGDIVNYQPGFYTGMWRYLQYGGNGTTVHYTQTGGSAIQLSQKDNTPGSWSYLSKMYYGFDTSSLPDYSCPTGTLVTQTSATHQDGNFSTSNHSSGGWNQGWKEILGDPSNQSPGHPYDAQTSMTLGANRVKSQLGFENNAYTDRSDVTLSFDTSSIPSDSIITSAYIDFKASAKYDTLGTADFPIHISLIGFSPGDVANNSVVSNFRTATPSGDPPFANDLIINDISTSQVFGPKENQFRLNDRGIDSIDPTGASSFMIVIDHFRNGAPMWRQGATGLNAYVDIQAFEDGGRGARLTVNYSEPCANKGYHSAYLKIFTSDSANQSGLGSSVVLTDSNIPDLSGNVDILTLSDFKDGRWYNTELGNRIPISMQPSIYSQGGPHVWNEHFPMMAFNERGLHSFNPGGITYFNLRSSFDLDYIGGDDPPTIRQSSYYLGTKYNTTGGQDYMTANMAEYSGTNRDPQLIVIHGDNSASIGDAQVIQSGGETIVLDLWGTHWVDAGATFDAQRQNIINGLTGSLGAGSTNWNTSVRDDMNVSEVVRTSDSRVTITLLPHVLFNPSTPTETISITIPGSAIKPFVTGIVPDDIVLPENYNFSIDQIPFGFTSISPTIAGNSGSLELTLTGLGLPGPTFTLPEDVIIFKSGAPASPITCTPNSGGGTSVVVSCIVDGIQTGDWSVKVTEAGGLNATLTDALTIYEPWSSTVNGGSFNDSGSDYAVFAHDGFPYFTVQAFDEVDKEWDASSSPPLILPTAVGLDGQFTSDVEPSFNGKDRLVIGTASATPALFAYEFNPSTGTIGDVSNPSSGAIAMDINDLDIGVGDNIVVVVTDGGEYVYMYNIDEGAAIATFWTGVIAAPSSPPGVECNAVDINADATYVAIGCTTTPYLHVWAINNGGSGTPSWGSKVATVVDLPDGAINGVKFSPDGTQIAIAIDTSPYVEVYEFNGGTIGDKASSPLTLPTGIGYDVDWQKENVTGLTNLAVAHDFTPFISVYPFTTNATAAGIFGVKLDNPSTLPTGTASSIGFHTHDDAIFVGHAASPYVTAYNFTGVSDDDYRVYRYMANFDTSYLPTDAVITSAVLSIYVNTVNVGTDWQLLIQDGVNSSEPLVVGDYDHLSHVGASIGSATASGIVSSTYNDITLGSFGSIDPDGITQLLLRHEEDIGNTPPTVVETVDIAVGDSTTFPEDCLTSAPATLRSNSIYNLCNSPNAPRLRVTYTSATGLTTGDPLLADLEVVLLDSHTANIDGTHTTTVVAKGPIVFLDVSTSPTTSVYDFDLNRSIVDSTDPWSFLSSTVGRPFPFMKNFKSYADDGTTQILWYEMDSEPKADMADRSAYGHDSSYYSFPTDSTSITSILGITLPIAGVSVSIGEGAGVPSMADDTSDANLVLTGTSNTSNEGLPMAGFFDYVEEAGGMPSGILKLMFAMVVTILAGLVAFKSFQSVAATYIAMLMAIVAFTLGMNGIFEWWMLLTFGLTGGIFIFTRRAYV